VVVAVIQVVGTRLAAREQPDATALDLTGYALLLAGPAALVVRRWWPLSTLAAAAAAATAYLCLDYPRGPFMIAAIVALFGATRRANRAAVRAIVALAYTSYVVITSLWTVHQPTLAGYIGTAAWVLVAVMLAEFFRVRSENFAEIARARQEAARARQEQERRQASDERLRIARELHDVLGHHLSLINVRAGVALHLIDSQPEQARDALSAIKDASAEALREVRGVLGALHPLDESAPRSPTPGLSDLDHLATEAREAGLEVQVRREGERRRLPAEVDRAAYRIVQEALTNVRRHAGPSAEVTVTIGYADQTLAIQVDDTGTGPQGSTSDGNGIAGMRQRAVALGGTLVAQERLGGGFTVRASLPLPAMEVM
jgi:signal transduction histidine kinase